MKRTENKSLSILMMLAMAVLICVVISLSFTHSAQAANVKTVKINQFDTKQLQAKIADAPQINWSSSDTRVCVVNTTGLVQAVGGGTCTITASAGGLVNQWKVTVKAVKLNDTSLSLLEHREGKKLRLNIKKARNEATWSSSRSKVATVDKNGYVTPHFSGTCKIYAKWNGVTLTCNVKVRDVNVKRLRDFRSPKKSSNRREVVIAGSTLMDRWEDVYSDFGSQDVINNSIPNSTIKQWNGWYKKLITDYKPRAVIILLGSEDLRKNSDLTGEQCAENLQKLMDKIHKKYKKAKLFYCSNPLYPGRDTEWHRVSRFIHLMNEYCNKKKFATYLGVNYALSGKDMIPSKKYFDGSNMYLTESGYNRVKHVVVSKVKKAAKKK